jgi:hypothetical protein
LNEILKICEELGPDIGLVVNRDKTAWISVDEGNYTQEAILLGSHVGSFEKTLSLRLQKAWNSFFALKKNSMESKRYSNEDEN